MTPVGELLANEIRREGPIPFRRFMEMALYHPEHGYYRRARDPFGVGGDFFTAEQIQPVFGILMAARIRQLYREMGEPREFTVVELGSGRGEMAAAFSEWRYVPLEIGAAALPERFHGVVFSNEFFDALPVDVAVYRGGEFLEQRVAYEEASGDQEASEAAGDHGRFQWWTGPPVGAELDAYFREYWAPPEEGRWYEAGLEGLRWLERISRALEAGYVLTVDYGFTRAESIRFPAGTLMGYRRHQPLKDVLTCPGERDITAHVNFTALQSAGARYGLQTQRFETLAQTLLAAGERDQFAAALGGGGSGGELRRRMQLKTLLFGMGETFRVLLQRRREP